jgi:hypothetical protein
MTHFPSVSTPYTRGSPWVWDISAGPGRPGHRATPAVSSPHYTQLVSVTNSEPVFQIFSRVFNWIFINLIGIDFTDIRLNFHFFR